MKRGYQRTARTIASGGNRNPANVDFGGIQGRERVDGFTAQACLDPANAQCNGALVRAGARFERRRLVERPAAEPVTYAAMAA
ncbi:hypothetical protein GCM10023176_55770 [Micromonospora coerulea]|uniref:Uncharacterized protein n=1 Tax=Micromonospora coerulea TaxID=47856 RepID=A0ABP8T393_9ACTN